MGVPRWLFGLVMEGKLRSFLIEGRGSMSGSPLFGGSGWCIRWVFFSIATAVAPTPVCSPLRTCFTKVGLNSVVLHRLI